VKREQNKLECLQQEVFKASRATFVAYPSGELEANITMGRLIAFLANISMD
jgi:hypothetical protein